MDFFGIGPLELFLIVIVALVALGPKRLPQFTQRMGRFLAQARREVTQARQSLMVDTDLDGPDRSQAPAAQTSDSAQARPEPPGPASG